MAGNDIDGPGRAGDWLDLLVADAPVSELVRFRADQESRLTDAVPRARIATQAAQALQLRSMLDQMRLRTTELRVLNDVAAKLTVLRNVDELLQEIVQQTRDLLSMDIAYLGLVSESRDELVLVVTAGALSPQLRGLHVSLQTGIAEAVVSTGTPQWTLSYIEDAGITHSAASDFAIQTEQIDSLLGVPMQLRGQVIGVLFVGQRKRQSFNEGQITLLTSLAAHATIAIDNARLFEEAERAAQELDLANKQLQKQSAQLDRAVLLHDRLIEIALAGGTVDDVVAELATGMGVAVAFYQYPVLGPDTDQEDDIVWCHAEGFDRAALDHVAKDLARRKPEVTVQEPIDDGVYLTSIPVTLGDERFGSFLLATQGHPHDATVREIRRGGLVVSLVVMTERAVSDAELRSQGEFLLEILKNPERTAERLLRRGSTPLIDLNVPHWLATFAPGTEDMRRTIAVATALAKTHGGVFAEYSGRGVLLVAQANAQQLSSIVQEAISVAGFEGERPTVGIAGPAVGATAIARAFVEASHTTELLLALNRPETVALATDLGAYQFLFSHAGRGDAASFVESTIGALQRCDADRGTELVRTVESFLSLGQRHSATAKALFIHSNTLYQRFERVSAVLGNDWASPERALEIQLAIRLQNLLTKLDQGTHR